MTTEHQTILVRHILGSLPADLERRKHVLESLLVLLPPGELALDVRNLLSLLNHHSIVLRELLLNLDQANLTKPNDSPHHDGPPQGGSLDAPGHSPA